MHAQVRAADDFPYRLVGARRSGLSAVYVRQEVAESRPSPEEPDPGVRLEGATVRPITKSRPDLDDPGDAVGLAVSDVEPTTRDVREAMPVAPRTVEDALGHHRHLLIIGGPGQGKLTLTLQLTGQLARDLLDGVDSAHPVLVPIRVTAADLLGVAGRCSAGYVRRRRQNSACTSTANCRNSCCTVPLAGGLGL